MTNIYNDDKYKIIMQQKKICKMTFFPFDQENTYINSL